MRPNPASKVVRSVQDGAMENRPAKREWESKEHVEYGRSTSFVTVTTDHEDVPIPSGGAVAGNLSAATTSRPYKSIGRSPWGQNYHLCRTASFADSTYQR